MNGEGIEADVSLTAFIPLTDIANLHAVVEKSEIYRGRVFGMATDLVQLPTADDPVRRDYLSHPGAVAIVALREVSGSDMPEICLIRQYRHPVGAYLWEIPAGLCDVEGEAALATAKRELWEETDLEANRWDVLVDLFTSGGCSTEALRVFLARDVYTAATAAKREDEEADIIVRWVPLDEAVAGVLSGDLHSCSVTQGVLAAWTAFNRGWIDLRDCASPWFKGGYPAARFQP